MSRINLKMKYAAQGKESANCGPCSIKMVADYLGVVKRDGEEFSVPSLNRICRVSKKWGTEFSDMNKTLKKLGLKRNRVSLKNLDQALMEKKPILSVFIDVVAG